MARSERDKWKMTWENRTCWCGCGRVGSQCHEIARGPSRKAALECPATWFWTCPECHGGPLDAMPIAEQLAFKLYWDPENFDHVAVNTIRGRAPNSTSIFDVLDTYSKLVERGILPFSPMGISGKHHDGKLQSQERTR